MTLVTPLGFHLHKSTRPCLGPVHTSAMGNQFPCAYPLFLAQFLSIYRYLPNPLASNQTFLIGGNPNLQLIETPGHTPQDTSLILTQGPTKTALVGDTILNEGDVGNTSLSGQPYSQPMLDSRKLIFCQTNFIIPGHGPMFTVTQQMKTDWQCP